MEKIKKFETPVNLSDSGTTSNIDWLLDPKRWWLRHLLFWVFYYMDKILSWLGITDFVPFEPLSFLTWALPDLALVYIHLYVLMPKLLFKDKLWLFIGCSLLTILAYAGLVLYIDYPWDMWQKGEDIISPYTYFFEESFLWAIKLLALAGGIKLFTRHLENTQRLQLLENATLETELTFLKSQVNPHFLFNALNGIHVQAEKYPDKVGDSIALLSHLLRYQLYDGAKERVLLNREIDYLHNFLEFNKQRKNKMEINFKVEGRPNGITLPPFLFIPFIENAVKHGLNNREATFITVLFKIESEVITFTVENSKPEKPIPSEVGGIGLPNVKRRLDLLYENNYQLDIETTTTTYKITLVLNIEQYEMYHRGRRADS